MPRRSLSLAGLVRHHVPAVVYMTMQYRKTVAAGLASCQQAKDMDDLPFVPCGSSLFGVSICIISQNPTPAWSLPEIPRSIKATGQTHNGIAR